MKVGRMIVCMALFGQVQAFGQARDLDADLPLNVKSALQEMERAILNIRQKTADKLKIAMRSEMQAGNLARANRINQEIARLEKVADKAAAPALTLTEGAWKCANGTVVRFRENSEVEWGENSWSGTWREDSDKVYVTLNKLKGQLKPSAIQFYLEKPGKRAGADAPGQMTAQPGFEGFNMVRLP